MLATYADALSELARDKIPPSEAAVASLQASLLVCGVSSESCASFTGAPDWAKVAAALAEALPTLAGEGKKDFGALLAADADGTGAARFHYPGGMSREPQGSIVVADFWNHRVRRVEPRTGIVSTVAGSGPTGLNEDAHADG